MKYKPLTVLSYGTPNSTFLQYIQEKKWGLCLENALARDPVFTISENYGRADAIIAFPDAHPLHLVTVIAEAEVGHPLIRQDIGGEIIAGKSFAIKPIIFLGEDQQWVEFRGIFSAMREQGLIRQTFDRTVHYATSIEQAGEIIEQKVPATIPSTRLAYYIHNKVKPDVETRHKDEIFPPGEVTVATFGSANTKDPHHLSRAEQFVSLVSSMKGHILHGGGDMGVMGALSKAGIEHPDVHVIGVTVYPEGAPGIYFEKAAGDMMPEGVNTEIKSKDMIHRIETYAGNSHAFVSLDGGIGSTQEILMIAELRSQEHPVVKYLTREGEYLSKPLFVLNESGVYSPLQNYLKERGLEYLLNEIIFFTSSDELGLALKEYFDKNKPVALTQAERAEFRKKYRDMSPPLMERYSQHG